LFPKTCSSLCAVIDVATGDLPPEEWEVNQLALIEGQRLLSAYADRNGIRFWIITVADRSSTAVLLPEDY